MMGKFQPQISLFTGLNSNILSTLEENLSQKESHSDIFTSNSGNFEVGSSKFRLGLLGLDFISMDLS